jgi:hypothetical protein
MTIGCDELIRDNILGNDSEEKDIFGAGLAVGDFNNDDKNDLAIGSPGEDFGFKFSDLIDLLPLARFESAPLEGDSLKVDTVGLFRTLWDRHPACSS